MKIDAHSFGKVYLPSSNKVCYGTLGCMPIAVTLHGIASTSKIKEFSILWYEDISVYHTGYSTDSHEHFMTRINSIGMVQYSAAVSLSRHYN